jgi:hypothetical protein
MDNNNINNNNNNNNNNDDVDAWRNFFHEHNIPFPDLIRVLVENSNFAVIVVLLFSHFVFNSLFLFILCIIEVSVDQLDELNDEVLKELGFAVGHRLAFLKASRNQRVWANEPAPMTFVNSNPRNFLAAKVKRGKRGGKTGCTRERLALRRVVRHWVVLLRARLGRYFSWSRLQPSVRTEVTDVVRITFPQAGFDEYSADKGPAV